jgi:hypothetical protein
MELCGGFIRCVPGRMLVDPGDVGLALDRQNGTPLAFLDPESFSGLSEGPWQARKYSVRRDNSHWTQVGMVMSEHRIRSERQHRPVSSLMAGADITTRSRGATRPRFATNFRTARKERAQGMPDARCTRGLVCEVHKRKCTRAYRFSGGNPTFPAQWFYDLCRALPGDEFVLSPSSADIDVRQPGWAAKTSADLTPATGARTTRFCRTLQACSSAYR